MITNPLNKTFDPQTLAEDLVEVQRIHAKFSAALETSRCDAPIKGNAKERGAGPGGRAE